MSEFSIFSYMTQFLNKWAVPFLNYPCNPSRNSPNLTFATRFLSRSCYKSQIRAVTILEEKSLKFRLKIDFTKILKPRAYSLRENLVEWLQNPLNEGALRVGTRFGLLEAAFLRVEVDITPQSTGKLRGLFAISKTGKKFLKTNFCPWQVAPIWFW